MGVIESDPVMSVIQTKTYLPFGRMRWAPRSTASRSSRENLADYWKQTVGSSDGVSLSKVSTTRGSKCRVRSA